MLAYIDAMPDSATGFRPTPGVRSFAEQFDHIVTTNLEVAAIALRGQKAAPALGDSSAYLHDKAALRKYAAATYDYLLKALQEAKPDAAEQAGGDLRPAASAGEPAGHALVRALSLDPGPDRALSPAEWSHSSRIPHAVLIDGDDSHRGVARPADYSPSGERPECSAGVPLPFRAGSRTRRYSSQHQCVPAGRATRTTPVSAHPHAVRHRGRHGSSRELSVLCRRRLHLRVPGYPRQIQERRTVHHESAAA